MYCLEKFQRELAYFLDIDLRDLPKVQEILKAQGYTAVKKNDEIIELGGARQSFLEKIKTRDLNYLEKEILNAESIIKGADIIGDFRQQAGSAKHKSPTSTANSTTNNLKWQQDGNVLRSVVELDNTKVLQINADEAIAKLHNTQGQPIPQEIDIQTFKNVLESIENQDNFITHLQKKQDAQSRLAYLNLVEPTLKEWDIKLTKGDRKELIKVFNDGDNFFTLLITEQDNKRLITFIPKARDGYIESKIKNADLIQTFTSRASESKAEWTRVANYNKELKNAKANPYPHNADEVAKSESISNLSLEQGYPQQYHLSNTNSTTNNLKWQQDGNVLRSVVELDNGEKLLLSKDRLENIYIQSNHIEQVNSYDELILQESLEKFAKDELENKLAKQIESKGLAQEQWCETFNLKSLDESYTPKFSDEVSKALEPILQGEQIKLTSGSLLKLMQRDRLEFLPYIKDTLEYSDIVIKDKENALIFAKDIGQTSYFTSVSKNDKGEWVISTNSYKTINQLKNRVNDSGEILYISKEAPNILAEAFTTKAFSNELASDIIPQMPKDNSDPVKTFEYFRDDFIKEYPKALEFYSGQIPLASELSYGVEKSLLKRIKTIKEAMNNTAKDKFKELLKNIGLKQNEIAQVLDTTIRSDIDFTLDRVRDYLDYVARNLENFPPEHKHIAQEILAHSQNILNIFENKTPQIEQLQKKRELITSFHNNATTSNTKEQDLLKGLINELYKPQSKQTPPTSKGLFDEVDSSLSQEIKDIIDSSPQKGRDMQIIGEANFTPQVVEYAHKNNKKVAIDKLSQAEAEQLGYKYPNDVRVTIDYSAINHTLNRHGAESALVKNSGQKAVDYTDIAEYRNIVKGADESLDSVDNMGTPVVVSYKQINGHFVVVEEIRKGQNELNFKTMFKQEGNYKDSESYKKTSQSSNATEGYEPTANSFALTKKGYKPDLPTPNNIIPQKYFNPFMNEYEKIKEIKKLHTQDDVLVRVMKINDRYIEPLSNMSVSKEYLQKQTAQSLKEQITQAILGNQTQLKALQQGYNTYHLSSFQKEILESALDMANNPIKYKEYKLQGLQK
ncbi:PBECR3 domain-containing polyvalent protein [Helicobacter magdeburgensis]|uniref:PBECR3 domain-containing polyvalent protein n=1 Tax=Helicobacter magdeburgensis TaxID=471858 RepID=UPI00068AD395|nr:PBECR2 nuclease fold domain-containing protein [Helicobacter magdeburgensis]